MSRQFHYVSLTCFNYLRNSNLIEHMVLMLEWFFNKIYEMEDWRAKKLERFFRLVVDYFQVKNVESVHHWRPENVTCCNLAFSKT